MGKFIQEWIMGIKIVFWFVIITLFITSFIALTIGILSLLIYIGHYIAVTIFLLLLFIFGVPTLFAWIDRSKE